MCYARARQPAVVTAPGWPPAAKSTCVDSDAVGKEDGDGVAGLCADRAGGAVQPALPDVRDPVPAGWSAVWPASFHAVRDVHATGRPVPWAARAAPARAGRTDDAPALLRD